MTSKQIKTCIIDTSSSPSSAAALVNPNETLQLLLEELAGPAGRGTDQRLVLHHLTSLHSWIKRGGYMPTVNNVGGNITGPRYQVAAP